MDVRSELNFSFLFSLSNWHKYVQGAPKVREQYLYRYCLDSTFIDNWTGTVGPTGWPPRSPELTPSDSLLQDHVKFELNSVRIELSNHLQSRRRQEIHRIDPRSLEKFESVQGNIKSGALKSREYLAI